mgnify:CR=1 FL=1
MCCFDIGVSAWGRAGATSFSSPQRVQQALSEKAFIQQALGLDPQARIVSLGDFNDFEFSAPIRTLTGEAAGSQILFGLAARVLPPEERYSYVFEGNSQAIDHILLSNHLFSDRPFAYDVVHVNSEFAAQASDHEPQVVRIAFDIPPVYLPVIRR